MTNVCAVPRCGQDIPNAYFVCSDCKRVLRQDLSSVPALVEDLLTTITRQDVLGASGGRRAAETAIPWKDHATRVLWDLNSAMTGWVRVLLEQNNLSSEVVDRAYDGQSTHHRVTSSASRWLLAHIDSLTLHEAAGEAIDEIGDAVQRAYHAIDRPAEKLPAGQCMVNDCQAYLYAEPQAETVDCPKCGITHDMEERHAWMSEAAREHRVTATEALGWVHMLLKKPMPDGTWRRWLADGRIHHDDMDHLGHKLYRWGDVVEVVRDWIARPRKTKEDAA
jgi:hypothetical protein